MRDLRKGELILRVPKSALMTRESLLKDEKLSVAVSRHPSLSSTQVFLYESVLIGFQIRRPSQILIIYVLNCIINFNADIDCLFAI